MQDFHPIPPLCSFTHFQIYILFISFFVVERTQRQREIKYYVDCSKHASSIGEGTGSSNNQGKYSDNRKKSNGQSDVCLHWQDINSPNFWPLRCPGHCTLDRNSEIQEVGIIKLGKPALHYCKHLYFPIQCQVLSSMYGTVSPSIQLYSPHWCKENLIITHRHVNFAAFQPRSSAASGNCRSWPSFGTISDSVLPSNEAWGGTARAKEIYIIQGAAVSEAVARPNHRQKILSL